MESAQGECVHQPASIPLPPSGAAATADQASPLEEVLDRATIANSGLRQGPSGRTNLLCHRSPHPRCRAHKQRASPLASVRHRNAGAALALGSESSGERLRMMPPRLRRRRPAHRCLPPGSSHSPKRLLHHCERTPPLCAYPQMAGPSARGPSESMADEVGAP